MRFCSQARFFNWIFGGKLGILAVNFRFGLGWKFLELNFGGKFLELNLAGNFRMGHGGKFLELNLAGNF